VISRRSPAWRSTASRQQIRALEPDPPADLVAVFGPPPEDRKGRETWRVAVGQVDGYRRGYGIEQARLAKHGVRSERGEPADATPAEDREDRQAWSTSDPAQQHRRPARPDRRASRG
jgi:hypothetical protein